MQDKSTIQFKNFKEKEIKEMVVIVLILLGIVVEIINANAWFIIPDFVSLILFGLAGLGIVFNIINYFVVKKQMKKMNDRFDDHFSSFGRRF